MSGLRKVFVGVGLAIALAVASGPAALAQSESASDSGNVVGDNIGGSSGNNNSGVHQTGGQSRAGNTLNRTSNVNQGSSSIAGGVTDNSGATEGAPLASTSESGAPATKAAGTKAATKAGGSAASGDLARTGAYTVQLALLGFGALLVGCLMVRYSWRPRMLVSASATHVREALTALADLHSRA
jgi:hypothetical protein